MFSTVQRHYISVTNQKAEIPASNDRNTMKRRYRNSKKMQANSSVLRDLTQKVRWSGFLPQSMGSLLGRDRRDNRQWASSAIIFGYKILRQTMSGSLVQWALSGVTGAIHGLTHDHTSQTDRPIAELQSIASIVRTLCCYRSCFNFLSRKRAILTIGKLYCKPFSASTPSLFIY